MARTDLVAGIKVDEVVGAVIRVMRKNGRRFLRNLSDRYERIDTIAECVGDQQVLQLLYDLGVDYGQGYHLGRPQPLHEILPALTHA